MANVSFKQGTQENLDIIRSKGTAVEGAFYFTLDTHRLYKGQLIEDLFQEDEKTPFIDAVPVNEGITTVASVNNLPFVEKDKAHLYTGQFYYVEDGHILCVYNGSGSQSGTKGWIQLNANTDTNISDFTNEFTTNENSQHLATLIISDTNGNDYETSFGIEGTGGTKVTVDKEGYLETVTVDGVSNTIKHPLIKIEGEEYTLDSKIEKSTPDAEEGIKKTTVSVILKSSDTNKDASEIPILTAGKNIKIDEDDGTISSITNFQDSTFTITPEKNGYLFSIMDEDGNTIEDALQPVITIGGTKNTQQEITFSQNTATLPIYTKKEIDDKLAHLDGMTYKGTVGVGGAYSGIVDILDIDEHPDGVKAGDTFKVVSNVAGVVTKRAGENSTTETAKTGDLIIATGTEYTEEDFTKKVIEDESLIGTIKPDTLIWSIIAAGDDEEVTYKLTALTGDDIGFVLKDSAETPISEITFSAGDHISLTQVGSQKNPDDPNDSGEHVNNSIQIKHAQIQTDKSSKTAVQPAHSTKKINVITGINIDDKKTGHVSGIETTEITLTDTNGLIGYNEVAITADSQKASGTSAIIKSSVQMGDVEGSTISIANSSYEIVSNSLNVDVTPVTAGSTGKTVDGYSVYTQNNTPQINIDLVWGSFDEQI